MHALKFVHAHSRRLSGLRARSPRVAARHRCAAMSCTPALPHAGRPRPPWAWAWTGHGWLSFGRSACNQPLVTASRWPPLPHLLLLLLPCCSYHDVAAPASRGGAAATVPSPRHRVRAPCGSTSLSALAGRLLLLSAWPCSSSLCHS